MVLLGLYVGALILGGGLLAASSLLGGQGHDHDHEFGGDHDVEVGADHDVELGGDHDVELGGDHDVDGDPGLHGDPAMHSLADAHVGAADAIWMPILSLRFWTFFLAFFGLTGSLVHGLGALGISTGPWFVTLALALAAGVGSGLAITRLLRALKSQSANSGITPERDYVGKSAEVLLDVAPGDPGQVRIEVKGASIDVKATVPPDGGKHLRGSKVIVLSWADGAVQVAPFDTGEATPGRAADRPIRPREPA